MKRLIQARVVLMINKPLISIVVPVYNTGMYLQRCLETISNQSYSNKEIIIVNDFSTDNSHDIILKFAEKNNNIRYIKLDTNIGVGNARNVGIDNATGAFIGFVDSDDWIDISFYDELVEQMLSVNADMGIAGIKTEIDDVYYSTNRYVYSRSAVIDGRTGLHALVDMYSSDIRITPIVNNKLYKTSLIKDNKLSFDLSRRSQDNYFSFMALLYSDKVSLVNNIYYHYYQRPFSATHNFSTKYIDDYIAILEFLKQTLLCRGLYEEYSEEYSSYVMRCCTAIINNLFMQEQSDTLQKKHLLYILKLVDTLVPWSTLANKISIERFKRFWDRNSE
ncbi:MAG: glycosyltransferase [Ruminococcaceae bacterium]|nr:glycosyltransferase [Oscillospiraceae bacterium]